MIVLQSQESLRLLTLRNKAEAMSRISLTASSHPDYSLGSVDKLETPPVKGLAGTGSYRANEGDHSRPRSSGMYRLRTPDEHEPHHMAS